MEKLKTAMGSLSLGKMHRASDRNYLIKQQLELLAKKSGTPTLNTAACEAPNKSLPIIQLVKGTMISIEDILRAGPGNFHKGKFLLCRSIMGGARTDALILVIDDPAGHRCLRVAMYNFPGIIHPGTILAIMHPWFKRSEEESALIQVENPQHVHIFFGNEALIRNLIWKAPLPKETAVVTDVKNPDEDMAKEGNRYFLDKNYPKAVEAYSKSMETYPKSAILYSNRSQAYLKMDKPLLALKDTEIGLKLDPANIKLQFRKGKALILLKRYEEAWSFLEMISHEYKNVMEQKPFADLVVGSKRMGDEFVNGNYNILEMVDEAKRSKLLEDHADYFAKGKIEVKSESGKRPILVAKEKIEMGTLLMACKAFVFTESSELAGLHALARAHLGFASQEAVIVSWLFQKAEKKLAANPELGDDFYKLYSGTVEPSEGTHAAMIVHYNRFTAEEAFAVDNPAVTGAGVWIMPSYMGHSCVDYNSIRYVVGDFMFIRACKEINPGDQLLMPYVSPEEPFKNRRDMLKEFDIDCSCRLCQADGDMPKKIELRLDEIKVTLSGIREGWRQRGYVVDPKDEAILRRLLDEVLKYRPDMDINFLAENIQSQLACVCAPVNSTAMEFLEGSFKVHQNAGDLHKALIEAKILSMTWKDKKKAAAWKKIAQQLAKMVFGDERLLDLVNVISDSD